MCATPATIALGGVPTGMWKAIEQARVAGTIKYRGSISRVRACGLDKLYTFNSKQDTPLH